MAKNVKLPRGIRLSRSGKLFVDVTIQGRRATATCETMAEAVAKQAELKHRLLSGEGPGHSGSTAATCWSLEEAWQHCYEHHWEGTASGDGTILISKEALEFFGADTPLSSIDTAWMDEWVTHMKETRRSSNSTINHKLAWVSMLFTWACQRYKQSGVTSKPHFPRQKGIKGRLRCVSDEEEARMLALCEQWGEADLHDVIVVLVETGMRLGELRRMAKHDVNLKTGMVAIWVNKTDKPRSVPLLPRTRKVIERRLARGMIELFPFTKDWIRRPWARLKTAMDLDEDKHFVPHALRHTCATRLALEGIATAHIQLWMGHASMQMTQRYTHLRAEDLLPAAQALERRA